jgi:polyhydroxyalkanoate synthase
MEDSMTSPSHVPDEFVQGFIKSGQSLWQAMLCPAGMFPRADAVSVGTDGTGGIGALAELQLNYFQQQLALWTRMMASVAGEPDNATGASEKGDRRFKATAWRDVFAYSLLKQGYLLNSRLISDMVEAADLDEPTRQRLSFYTRQFIDSMSPANFAATNPEVMQLAFETGGQSLRAGFENLLKDMGQGALSITDQTAFEIGKNVAVSEGAVLFENELFQLIQYAPLTDQVARRPLLIVPPCINKFYILDLQPANSFVRFAVEQGNTVFLVSWRNPDAACGHFTWDDYLSQGAIRAIEVALAVSSADKLNALGWCVGGTILSSALAVLRARSDISVASLTLLTTMLDFSDPGELGIFIDEQGVSARERSIGKGGIYSGAELGFVFQTLRANDLIWPNVINNYLKGKAPEAFDLLYWNADSTNLPGPMYAWYLRNMYLENNLCVPNRLTMCGTHVDLGRIDVPSYVLATHEDHIVPWKAAYRTTQLVGGKTQFVLGASGHIAGVINPASKNKRSYWTGGNLSDDAEKWLASAEVTPGSWWTHWVKWLAPYRGKSVDARRKLGNNQYVEIEPAPGRYVKTRAS